MPAVLVTGAQQGIGEGTAIAFAKAGYDVGVNYLDDKPAAERVAGKVGELGRKAVLVQANVAVIAEIGAMVEKTVAELGRLDVLVSNAGVFPRVPFLEMKESDWDFVLDINLRGTAFGAQAAAKAMIKGGHGGSIINLASSAVAGRTLRGVHYTASKGGIVAMTRALATELAPHKIRVNAIAPGLTDTAQPRYGHGEEELAERAANTLIPRMGTAKEMGEVAVFLASEAAAYMTGQTLHVNGGFLMP